MRIVRVALALLLAAAVAAPAAAQQKPSNRMYKCVDPNGKVYYSDSPRADCQNDKVMNRQGVTVAKPEDKPGVAGAKAKDAKKPALSAAQRRDRALLATYTSEAEIDAARDRSLAIPEQGMKLTQSRLDKANNELFELKKQADALASQQKPLPPHLLEDVQARQKDVAVLESDLVQRKKHAEATRARFESDKLRFRELTTRTASN